MKKSIVNSTHCVSLLIGLLIFNVQFVSGAGSCFFKAKQSEKSCNCTNQPKYVLNTGNDAKEEYGPWNLDKVMVEVFDGSSNQGLHFYDITTGTEACIALPSICYDPDVALVKGTDNDKRYWYAVVVFTDGITCYWDAYRCDVSQNPPAITSIFQTNPTYQQIFNCPNGTGGPSVYGTSINIDAVATNDFPSSTVKELDDFLIVWDDPKDGLIRLQGGFGSDLYPPMFYYGQATIEDQHKQLRSPDVTLIRNGVINSPECRAYVSYVDNNTGDIKVEGGNFHNWVTSNNCTTINLFPSQTIITNPNPAKESFTMPRIACPNFSQVSSDKDWCVVSELYHPNGPFSSDIVGFTHLGNTLMYYTHGNTSSPTLCDINGVVGFRNENPVVTYTDEKEITFCWESEFIDPDYIPRGLLSVRADQLGILQSTCDDGTSTVQSDGYSIVSHTNNGPLSSKSYWTLRPSICGRDLLTHERLFTYFTHINGGDMVYKIVPFDKCNLRKKSPKSIQGSTIEADEINPDATYNISLFNTAGMQVVQTNLKGSEIEAYLKRVELISGMYFINIYSENSEVQITKKLIK